MGLGSCRLCGNNWKELELNPPRQLNPNGVLASGIKKLLQLFLLGEIQVGPLPYLRVLTVAEIHFSASTAFKGISLPSVRLYINDVAQWSPAWRDRAVDSFPFGRVPSFDEEIRPA